MAMRARGQRQHRRRAPHAADNGSGANATETAYARHQALMRVYASTSTRTTSSSYADDQHQHHHISQHDLAVIQRHFQFLRDDDADAERGNSDWEVRMSVRYYRKLYREYALADLSRFEEGKIGLRWRTESEVIAGKGQFVCGSKHCDARATLHSYELLFAYVEQGEAKRCLVKVRVCEACAAKLFFKKLERMRQKRKMKQQKKKKRKMEEIATKKRKRSDSSSEEEDNHDDADENSIHAICAAINAEETKDSSEATSSAYYFEDKKGERDHAFNMLLL
uniref:Uncharacterized protein n=1 Tax=Globisporangium ultimum (strain ATCC 200006 / CBS 805.95 / DAOM BR144) TaxID=431595 RepID=K3WIS9_GLOUD